MLFVHYLITVIFSLAGIMIPFFLPLPFDIQWKYSFFLAMLTVPVSALYLLRRGASLKRRILSLLLNPAVIYQYFLLFLLIWSLLRPEDFRADFSGFG